MADVKYHLSTFGGIVLKRVEDGSPLFVGHRKRLAFLAFLAAEPRGVSRDRVLALFWPDADALRARNALKQFVLVVRRELGDDAIEDGASGLRLCSNLVDADVASFRSALARGADEEAVAQYHGPFLDGVFLRDAPDFENWLETQRRSLHFEYTAALSRLAERSLRNSTPSDAVVWARTLAAADPLSTPAALLLMRSLEASGDPGGAVRHASIHAQLLREQLDVQSPAELSEEVNRIRAGAAAAQKTLASPRQENAVTTQLPQPSMTDPPPEEVASPPERFGRFRRMLVGAVAGASVVAGFIILVTAPRHGGPRLRVLGLVQLTIGRTAEIDPDISPDGRFVAYAASRRGEMRVGTNAMRVFVRQISGGRAVPVTTDSTADQRTPKWSPDGARIAFRTSDGIVIAPAFGGTPQLVVPDSGRDLSMGGWSHDGRWLAFADSLGIWVHDVRTGASRLVVRTGFGAQTPAWSPDDSTLAYVVGTASVANVAPSSIWLARIDGSHAHAVTDSVHLNSSPVFEADGQRLLFLSSREGGRDVFELSLTNGEPRLPRRVTTGADATSISLSADQRVLIYGAEMMRSNVWSAPIQPHRETSLDELSRVTSGSQEVECVSVSRDGKWLIYDSDERGNQDIYKMQLPRSDAVQLTSDTADDFCGTLSPGGREIAFYSFRLGGYRRVFTMLASGERQRPLPLVNPREHQWSPDWSPDGHELAFTAATTGARHPVIVTRDSTETWTSRHDIVGVSTSIVRWSPDGRYLVGVSKQGLVRISPSGDSVRILATQPAKGTRTWCFVAWGPSSSQVYARTCAADGETAFWAVPVNGGSARLLLRLADAAHASRRIEFSTDGQHLYFTMAEDQASLWMVQLAGGRQ